MGRESGFLATAVAIGLLLGGCSFDFKLTERQYLCEKDDDCIEGWRCNPGSKVCELRGPDVPVVGADCLDADGDGYGVGTDCRGEDCDDANPKAWEGAPEVCDGVDNDCDGATDDADPDYAAPDCPLSVGVCAGRKQVCAGAGGLRPCQGKESYGEDYVEEEGPGSCQDGKDNDCDGQTDEGCACEEGATRGCGSDVGECRRGQQRCQNGAWLPCEGEVRESPEVCDGLDNDCDNSTDEDGICGPCSFWEFLVVSDGSQPEVPAFRYCIDRWEASREDATAESPGQGRGPARTRPGVLPWNDVTFAEAQNACTLEGKSLCPVYVWRYACQGPGRATYPFGQTYQAGLCNGDNQAPGPQPTGQRQQCVSQWNPRGGNDENGRLYDMSGNLREWVEPVDQPFQRLTYGGSYASGPGDLTCASVTDFTGRNDYRDPETGFRCCRNLGR